MASHDLQLRDGHAKVGATQSGTFDRVTGSGATDTNAHMSSSSDLDDACDVVRSPVIRLTDTSTLSLWVRYDIEPSPGGQHYDRANVSLVRRRRRAIRTVIMPSSGRPVTTSPNGAANGTCATTGQAGWNGTTPRLSDSLLRDDLDSAAALNPGRRLYRRSRAACRSTTGPMQLDLARGLRLRRGDADELLRSRFRTRTATTARMRCRWPGEPGGGRRGQRDPGSGRDGGRSRRRGRTRASTRWR